MNKLEKARATIEEVDKEMVALFEKRFKAIKDVIEYKLENNLPINDSGREEYLIEKNLTYLIDKDLEEYYVSFLKEMFIISKFYHNA